MKLKVTNKTIDDLVAQLDRSFASGVGHVNVSVEDSKVMLEKIDQGEEDLIKEVEVLGSLDCNGNMACMVPTLMEGLDNEEKENEHE